MKHLLQRIIYRFANWLELIISCFLIAAICILSVKMLGSIGGLTASEFGDDSLSVFLSSCFNIIIAIELVKMLAKHSLGTVVEVLVFATARQMVVEHLAPLETLISILALAMLFAIRKYLFHDFDYAERVTYRANQKVRLIKALEHLDLDAGPDETLGGLVVRELEARQEEIGVGACIYYRGFALRISKMHENGTVTRVDVIKEAH